jgi:HSP20 family molecular chaperone IbpA
VARALAPAGTETKAEPEKSSEGAEREAPRPPGVSMNQEPDTNPGEAPDAANRRQGRRRRPPSLPGPKPDAHRPALRAPSPTIEPPARTPAAEVSLFPGHVYVTVELPRALKDALDIQATDLTLTVDAKRVEGPPYHVTVRLPVPVEPGSAKATYRNGVLDVALTRAKPSGGHDHGA